MFNSSYVSLIIAQILGLSGAFMVVRAGPVIGAKLTTEETLFTLPMALMITGTALSTVPASWIMSRLGRRLGFSLASLINGGLLWAAVYGIRSNSFGLFCAGTFAVGVQNAFIQQYRFAAAEVVAEADQNRAISFLLVGTLVAAVVGPALAGWGQAFLAAVGSVGLGSNWADGAGWADGGRYGGGFILISFFFWLAGAVLLLGYKHQGMIVRSANQTGRPLAEIIRKPLFWAAVAAATIGYGVMSFLMTATSLGMEKMEGFPMDDVTVVIQAHLVAMFLPAIFTGRLIDRLGSVPIIFAGIGLIIGCSIAGLMGRGFNHYLVALILLGVGWNFMFIGGTTLLTKTYRPEERFKVQAVNDLAIFSFQAVASLSVGQILFSFGWDFMLWLGAALGALCLALVWRMARPEANKPATP